MEKHTKAKSSAFSLIEVIGALAILTILAAAAIPVVIRRVDQSARVAESSSLNAISAALSQHILRSNNIPDATAWVQAVSAELGLAATNVSTTRRGWSRAYLIDPNFWTALPYNQSAGGTTVAPANARVIVVSSTFGQLPLTNGVQTAAVFNDLWSTPQNTRPTNSIWAAWKGRGDDLITQRLNLQPLFHRVILVNGNVGGQGYYSINGSTPALVPLGGAGMNTYYLDGATLGLYDTNQNLMAKEIINTDLSRVFEYGLWQDQLNQGVTTGPPISLDGIAATFYTNAPSVGWAAWNTSSKWTGTPQLVLGLMNAYMNGYTTWASLSPCFSFPNAPGQLNPANYFAPYNEINDAITAFTSSNGKGSVIVP